MIWKILMLVSIVLGSVLGIYSYEKKVVAIEKNIGPDDCEMHDKKLIFEDDIKKRCVTRFVNRGDSFDLSQETIANKINNLFKLDLKVMEKNPDEYNIYLGSTGKPVKYDPRLAHFLRFNVKSFVLDNTKIANYSIITKETPDVLTNLKNLACREPQFKKVKSLDKLIVFSEYLSKPYTDKTKEKLGKLDREEFSAFQELERKVGWFQYFVYNKNSIENFLLANECNNSIALVLNHCVIDPKFDMQMEELFWFVKSKRIGINIYCKNSNQNTWSLQKSKVLRAKD